MDHLELLNRIFLEELKKTVKALELARIARDNAPTAMESKSDTSRSKLESEVTMHELKIKELSGFINSIPRKKPKSDRINLWDLIKVDLPSGRLLISIVPGGMGGKKASEILFISDKTPIGTALMGKKSGDKFSFNGTKGKIVSVINI